MLQAWYPAVLTTSQYKVKFRTELIMSDSVEQVEVYNLIDTLRLF